MIEMLEKYKNYLYLYFGIGYLWAVFAGFMQLIYFEDIGFWLYMITFLINTIIWPFSMFSALIWLL